MNAPAETKASESVLESSPQPAIRRLPLAPIGGWRWSWQGSQTRTTPTKKDRVSSSALAWPRRMRLCGRSVFLWVLLWYAVVQVFPMFLEHRWQRIGPANEAQKWPALHRLIERDPDRPLLLMLGSSRAAWAFRAGCLDGMKDSDGKPLHVYNYGIPASGPIAQSFYLRDMLAEGIRPRFVLLECLPPLLCEAQRGALTEEGMAGFETLSVHRLRQWMPYLNRPGKRSRIWLEARIAPWYTFRRFIQLELKCLAQGTPFPTYSPVDDWGWTLLSPVPFSAEEREQRLEIARGGYLPGLERFRLGKKPTQAMREILELCRREKIPTALVIMPESSDFHSWYSEEAKTQLNDLFQELSRTYDAPIIDGTTWVADEDFEDGHHVQFHGADVFTYRLATELPRLLERSKTTKSD